MNRAGERTARAHRIDGPHLPHHFSGLGEERVQRQAVAHRRIARHQEQVLRAKHPEPRLPGRPVVPRGPGERKHETEEAKNHWYRTERTYGRFYRTVPLPEGVNAKEVTATFKNGVLEVTTPVRASAPPPPHKVEVAEPEEKVTVAA